MLSGPCACSQPTKDKYPSVQVALPKHVAKTLLAALWLLNLGCHHASEAAGQPVCRMDWTG